MGTGVGDEVGVGVGAGVGGDGRHRLYVLLYVEPVRVWENPATNPSAPQQHAQVLQRALQPPLGPMWLPRHPQGTSPGFRASLVDTRMVMPVGHEVALPACPRGAGVGAGVGLAVGDGVGDDAGAAGHERPLHSGRELPPGKVHVEAPVTMPPLLKMAPEPGGWTVVLVSPLPILFVKLHPLNADTPGALTNMAPTYRKVGMGKREGSVVSSIGK